MLAGAEMGMLGGMMMGSMAGGGGYNRGVGGTPQTIIIENDVSSMTL